MSLRALKETLKPCSGSSSSLGFSTSAVKLSQEIEPRRPPKSTLSQQLLRLQEGERSSPPTKVEHKIKGQKARAQFKLEHGGEEDEEDEEEDDDDGEEEEKRGRVKFGGPRSAAFQFDYSGPFEPLPLSSPGEDPPVQVSLILF